MNYTYCGVGLRRLPERIPQSGVEQQKFTFSQVWRNYDLAYVFKITVSTGWLLRPLSLGCRWPPSPAFSHGLPLVCVLSVS